MAGSSAEQGLLLRPACLATILTQSSPAWELRHLGREWEHAKSHLCKHAVPEFDGEEIYECNGHAKAGDDACCQVQLVYDDGKHSTIDCAQHDTSNLQVCRSCMSAGRAMHAVVFAMHARAQIWHP